MCKKLKMTFSERFVAAYQVKSVQRQPYADVLKRCFAKISQQENICVRVSF